MKQLILLLFISLLPITVFGQTTAAGQSDEKVVTFRFLAGQDMFYIPWGGNDAELNRLYALVDEYRSDITNGKMPIYVDGYCASGENAEAGFKIAVTRSNRVKSELITNKGLQEEHFVTKNHATTYTDAGGIGHKDMVVVTLRIPAGEAPEPVSPADEKVKPEPQPVVEQKPSPQTEPVEEAQPEPEPQVIIHEPATPMKPYSFAIRTNLLYDAFLMPTLGIEWRATRSVGIKLDGGLAWWGSETGKVQKMWLINPEARWYFGQARRLYAGVSGNYGEYNTYGYLLGKLFPDDTGYQGKLWGAGLTVGYQLPLSRSFSVDFNLGLGYTNLEYDSFRMTNETRVYKDKNKSKDFWGPTQAGISLVWTLGR